MNYENSLSLVNKSRKFNMTASPDTLSDAQKRALLKSYHPNYKSENFKALSFGANKGELLPCELSEAIENNVNGKSEIPKPYCETDVLVIGSGGAGLSAAIEANIAGAKVIIATKVRFGESNTALAKGGIQIPLDEAVFFGDTYNGGKNSADEKLVKALTEKGRDAIKWLEDLGILFDKDDSGEYLLSRAGGSSEDRLLSVGDLTGAAIIAVLKNEIKKRDITVLENHNAVTLSFENGAVSGAVFKNNEKTVYIKAKAVILATGGCGSLKVGGFETSNAKDITADGLSLAYEVGAKLQDCESLQYHPTGAVYPTEFLGQLITEKARSLGARLINCDGKAFVNSLEARDTVAAAIINECESGRAVEIEGNVGVWLDTPMIDLLNGSGTTEKQLPALYKKYKAKGIDITKTPILVYPTLHYQNGGIKINQNAQTTVNGLYAAGEVTGGIHGKNRLMGNSLLDIIVFGKIAGKNAAKEIK